MKHKRFISIIITLAAIMFTVSVQASPLHDAVEAGDLEKVKAAIAAGYDVNEIDKSNERSRGYGSTPLHRAAYNDNFEIVKYLVEHGAEVNGRSVRGLPVLRSAEAGKKIFQYLLQHGAGINAKDEYGKTILHTYSFAHNIKGIEYLLSHGADISAKDNEGKSPLHYAASSPYNTFFDIKKEMSRGETNDWTTSEETIRLLLDAGADVNARDNKGQTPLHYASDNTNVNVVKYLLKRGSSVKIRDNKGDTPFLTMFTTLRDAHAEKEVLTIENLLLAKGTDINEQNNNGDTALHLLAASVLPQYLDIVKHLIAIGANMDIRNKKGLTSLDIARQAKYAKFMNLFTVSK
jgi:serine/threonine-protein phosphatase 6 regulatory ankyrin repeat subunit A